MDVRKVWSKAQDTTKSATESITNRLDALAPACSPFAARWDAEADRRAKLRTPENLKGLLDAQKAHNSARVTAATAKSQRTAARNASKNPLSGARRAARTADKAARQHKMQAQAALKTARKNYPMTLKQVAVRAHAAHAVPAGIVSYLMSTPTDWTMWPGAMSAAVIGANVAALAIGRRKVAAVVDDGLSAEERRLVERLDPSYWVQHADERGLSGTVTTPVQVTPAGLVTTVRLDGRWKPSAFKAKHEEVRALLGARTDLRMEIKAGSHGDRAVITLRTRSAADGDDLKWSLTSTSFGVDTVTGDLVTVPLGERLLIAGRSGAGKSVASRPLLFHASEGQTNVLVIIDLKKVEGRLWDHRARVASTPEAVIALVDELVDEMANRLDSLPKGQATLVPTQDRPRITVVVDEGAEVVSVCDEVVKIVDYTEKGKPITEKRSALPGLESIARMGRAACVDLWWMTQKPTIGDGIPKQIAPQMSTSICLAVRTPAEARVVLGEDAQAKGWTADELPAPGVAYVRDGKRGPNPVRIRYMTDSQVMALPARPLWSRSTGVAPDPGTRRLQLVKQPEEVPASREADAPATNRDRVLRAVREGARTPRDITDRTGINKGTVSRELKALIAAGSLRKGDDGLIVLGEVSA